MPLSQCIYCGSEFDPDSQSNFSAFNCSFHPMHPKSIGNTDPRGDYAELWVFPCCGKGHVGGIDSGGSDVRPPQSPGCVNCFHAASKATFFISYSRADQQFVSFLEAELERRGYVIWRDTRLGMSSTCLTKLSVHGPVAPGFARYGALAQDSLIATVPIGVVEDSMGGCFVLAQRESYCLPIVLHFTGVQSSDSLASVTSVVIGDSLAPSSAVGITSGPGGGATVLYAQGDPAGFMYYLQRLDNTG